MVDRLTPGRRSRLMSRVRSKNTTPELKVRRLLHALGYRFRIHRRDLPGNPDIVLPSRKVAIFVHGCFWHRHPHCRKASIPSSNVAFWAEKFERNVSRDKKNRLLLMRLKWRVITIWECQTKDAERLSALVRRVAARIDKRRR